jgi:hypothetical protein
LGGFTVSAQISIFNQEKFMKNVVKVCLIFSSFLLFNSDRVFAKPANNPSPLTKSTDGKTYTNEFFKLSVEKLKGWYAQDPKEYLALQKRGSNLIAGDNSDFKKVLDASLSTTTPIFSFFEFPPGTPGKLNPSTIAVAENIKGFPGVKNGCDYLDQTKKISQRSQVKIVFADKCESRVLNGTEFKMVNAQLSLNGQQIKQRYFALVKNDHAIGVVQTYFNAESEAKVNQVVNTIKVKP